MVAAPAEVIPAGTTTAAAAATVMAKTAAVPAPAALIDRLMGLAAAGTHADDGRAYANLYTADGEFRYGRNRAVGREQLADLIRKIPFDRLPHHVTLNVEIELTADGARGRAYALLIPPGQGPEPTVRSTATYEDVLVKTSDGWRLKVRTLYMNALPPAPDPRTGSR